MISSLMRTFEICWWINSTLFVAGYSAWYIPPNKFWIAQTAALLLPLTGVFAFVSVIVFVNSHHWFRAGVTSVLCVLLILRFFQIIAPLGSPSGKTKAMILSHNTGFANGTPEWESSLIAEIRSLEPDIVLLQEAPTEHHENPYGISFGSPVAELLRESYSVRNFDHHPEFQTALPTLSIIGSSTSEDRDQNAEQYSQHDFFSRVEVTIEGSSIAIYNVHLKSFSRLAFSENLSVWDLSFWTDRFEQLKNDYVIRGAQATILADILRNETLPFIVCGDINSTINNWSYRQLMEMTQDSFAQTGTGWNATFPSQFPIFRIDYVLGSSRIQFQSVRVGGATPSDHRPIWTSFIF